MQEKVSSNYVGSDITIFKLSLKDYKSRLHWRDKNEFELEGKMYDVIKIEESNDGFIIYCLHDEKEEKLISNFNKLNEGRQEQKSFVTVHHHSNILYAVKNESVFFKIINNINSLPCLSASSYHSVSLDITTPPPRKIV